MDGDCDLATGREGRPRVARCDGDGLDRVR